ncbi:uncharacterized protein LOC117298991 isoform X2 [Asterias rubens]|uniref:uncharacterized protein LOC117298991 isoform X2 n=1 Tax=Asterias rubens TaxID=7604 RepID=UPI001455A76B|nr:uncharacterized protein LOC117298991 isoform X2 [Asterias rubens]
MICLMLECFLEFLDVFKTAMLLCFPSWCLWHLSCFLWKRSMRPLLYRILSSDLFFRCTVIYHEYCRWPVTYPPSSHMTVEETKTFCQQGYLSQVIKIPGFLKTLILKKYGYFKNLLFGDRNEIEQRSQANSREKRSRANSRRKRSRAKPREKRSRANEVEQRSGANEVEQRSGANEVEQRSGANEVEQRSGANEVEQRSGANEVEQRSGANEVEQRSGAKEVEQRSGANVVEQRSRANEVEQRSRAKEVEQRSGANEVEQRSGANVVEQRSRANEVEQRSRAKEVEQRSGANEVEQRSRANEVEQRSGANEVEQRSGANEVEQRSGAIEVETRSGANEVEQRSGANEVEQRSGANEVEQRSRANPREQRCRANKAEQRSQLNQWEQKSRSNQWEQKSRSNQWEQKIRSNEIEQITFQYLLNQPTRAALDTLTYRQGYPGKEDNIYLCENWLFYSNNKCGRNGMSIDQVHHVWYGDYSLLETCHDFIQWLFPIRELSMYNHRAQELQLHEAKSIMENPAASQRVLKSYHMMLDFWGMSLEDEKTGVIVRGDNWEERFRNLNRSSHNYLRITRMLKSLGELGFEHLKFPFLSFILCEVLLEKTLANASESCRHYWIYLLRDEEESGKIRKTALEYLG